MRVDISHGVNIRPAADDLHGLFIHAGAPAQRREHVAVAVRRRSEHFDLAADALPHPFYDLLRNLILYDILLVRLLVRQPLKQRLAPRNESPAVFVLGFGTKKSLV